jgi:hypothetical protein
MNESSVKLILGIVLIVAGIFICNRQQELVKKTKEADPAKVAVGAVVGAGVGAGVGAAIGGIGIVACGTGFGIPAGVVCLGLAAIIGGGGAAVGAAIKTEKVIVTTSPAYDTWVWLSLILIGLFLISWATWSWINGKAKPTNSEPTSV